MAIVVQDGVIESKPCSAFSRAEIISSQSLPKASQPVPRGVNTLHLDFALLQFAHKITIEHTVSLRKFDLGSSIDPLYAFDPEIEKTLRRLRKARNLVVNNSRSSDSVINSNQLCTDNSVASSNIFIEPGQMENNDRTLKELATLDVVYQPWCIQYPQLEPAQTYELKSGLIHLLPKFHGLVGED
ncbi:hypothetical protein CR513_49024, partial [Mucuna pruriens]